MDDFQRAVDQAAENIKRKPRRTISDEARERAQLRSITCRQCNQVGLKTLDGLGDFTTRS